MSLKFLLVTILYCICITCFAQEKQLKIACIGNSVTYGSTHKAPKLTSYPARLQQMLGDGYEVKNFGVPGATLLRKGHNPYVTTTAFCEMLSFTPDIAIIDLGLNDTDPGNWPQFGDGFAADYGSLIRSIRVVNPRVKIYLCTLTPIFNDHPRFKSGTREWFWKIQGQIAEVAQANKTELIDFHSGLYQRPELLPDNLHPNEEGAMILGNVAYQHLTGNFGGLQLPEVFGSHMVLQRNKTIRFYGTANADDNITVRFAGTTQVVTASETGKWEAKFRAMQAGGPLQATISTKQKTITLKDILIGEVWLCSGQSNMAFPLSAAINSTKEMLAAENKHNLRLFNYKPLAETNDKPWDTAILRKVNQLQYFEGSWETCDSTSAKGFSAVAYYFAKKLQEQLKVPVGLIQIAVGGSTAESWIDRYTMESDPILVDELHNWRQSDFYQPWTRERAETNLQLAADPKQRHPYGPCYNYEAAISRFTAFPIQGVIWYQGESNAHNMELHEKLFPALIKSWRANWGYELPFYYVQLSSLNRPSWTLFRNSQLQMLAKVPRIGMAVSSDVGDSTNVHPRRKKEVGERLGRLALHFTYKQPDVTPYGPMPEKAKLINGQIVVSFRYTSGQLKTSDNKSLRGFFIRNQRGVVMEVPASILGQTVVIAIEKSEIPKKIMYGWQPYTRANLVNREGLPASTFELNIE